MSTKINEFATIATEDRTMKTMLLTTIADNEFCKEPMSRTMQLNYIPVTAFS